MSQDLSPVKQALLEVRSLRSRLAALEQQQSEPIAVIGAGLRLPGAADTLEAFWDLLVRGADVIGAVPPERWDNAALYDPDFRTPGKLATRFGSFLEDVDKFDPAFFGISGREAESMDPQHRLLLEVAWEALERAGEAPTLAANRTGGVFLGISNSDYARLLLNDLHHIDPYVATGNLFSVAAGRLSYILGWHGPNLAVDTACSSSLVAVHLAVQSLRRRECDLALAGGVNLMLSPAITINFSKAQMMAPDGRCKTFDAAADGYVRGEGCVVIALKRLSDALADRNPILGLVRGAAINHDGRSGGLTAPNGPAQTAVIRAALQDAGVTPEEIGYVETHGTGTALGDPIEVHALLDALAADRRSDNPLLFGSVKTNLGHLEAAAGLAGLLKTLLVLQRRQIPPHLHLHSLNPHITLPAAAAIPTELTPWEAQGPRLAGVSSFGLSGTNAHVILQEAPAPNRAGSVSDRPSAAPNRAGSVSDRPTASDLRPLLVLPLSAHTPAALHTLAERYAAHLVTADTAALVDIACTAGVGRKHHAHRLAVVAADSGEAQRGLSAFGAGQRAPHVISGCAAAAEPDITFLYTGHGANYPGMGRQLYQQQPVFRAAVDECDAITRSWLEQPLLSVLHPALPVSSASLLDRMTYAQLALFSLQYALTQLWRSWGVQPTLVAGHSAGEYAAAAAAGVFSLEDSLRLVLARGRLFESPAMAGSMAAVFASPARVEPLLAPYAGAVVIAACNGPDNIVISGATAEMELALHALAAVHIKTHRLPIAQAAHSPLLDNLLGAFEQEVAQLHAGPAQVGFVSTVTGQVAGADELATPAYWRAHLRQPVRFQQAMTTLHELDQRIFVEIGPRPMLLALGQRCLPAAGNVWAPSLRRLDEDSEQMSESLALLYTCGAPIDWQGVYGARQRVELPTYPFGRQRYWTSAVAEPPPLPVDPQAAWDALNTAGELQAAQAPLDLAVHSYPAKWEALRQLSSAYIVIALYELGAWPAGSSQPAQLHTFSPASLVERHGVLPLYQSLLHRWLGRLAAEGVLTAVIDAQGEEVFDAAHRLPAPDLGALREAARLQLADAPMLFDYVERCGPQLAAVLTGRVAALETLFPGGSSALATALYAQWAGSRYYANLMRSILHAYSGAMTPHPLRILEVGAGTGATTAALLPGLPAARTLYEFTDVSELFLREAAVSFAAFDFLRFARLDLEQAPASQGFAPGSYTVIVATNVLHATADLQQTLDYLYELLAPGGLLLINEVTEHLAWLDITTALIEGWQHFEDDLRQDQPLLAAGDWERALHEHGFAAVAAWPAAGSAPAVLGQNVFAAIKPVDAASVPSDRAGSVSDRPALSNRAGSVSARPTPSDRAGSVSDRPASAALRARLQTAVADERHELLFTFVDSNIRQVLRLDASVALDAGARLLDLGVDSLMALELRRLLAAGLGLAEDSLSATLVFDYPTVGALIERLGAELAAQAGAASTERAHVLAVAPDPIAASATASVTPGALRAAEVAAMSEADVEALLLQKLKRRG